MDVSLTQWVEGLVMRLERLWKNSLFGFRGPEREGRKHQEALHVRMIRDFRSAEGSFFFDDEPFLIKRTKSVLVEEAAKGDRFDVYVSYATNGAKLSLAGGGAHRHYVGSLSTEERVAKLRAELEACDIPVIKLPHRVATAS